MQPKAQGPYISVTAGQAASIWGSMQYIVLPAFTLMRAPCALGLHTGQDRTELYSGPTAFPSLVVYMPDNRFFVLVTCD
jgi:hypothetical protein